MSQLWLWYLYSTFICLLAKLGQGLAWLRPSLRSSLQGRWWKESEWQSLQAWCQAHQNRLVFYCSSAGEYEQAKPLIHLLDKKYNYASLVVIFSESARRFALAQGDQYVIFKSPWDLIWVWRRFFKIIQPSFTVIVRHELWPAFLKAASEGGRPLVLIDAVVVDRPKTLGLDLKDKLKSFLYSYLTHIFVVGEDDASLLKERRLYTSDSIFPVGDTKYDRVFERLAERAARRKELAVTLDAAWTRKKRLIIGSAWPADVELVAECFQQAPDLRQEWQVIIAPHEIKAEMIDWLLAECQRLGLSYRLWSELEAAGPQVKDHEVLIVNALGILAELYGCAELAFVGGALHHRVHNVLEPACHGLPVAFGPNFETSQEAKWLVSQSCARVVSKQSELLDWWQSWHKNTDLVDHQLLAEVKTRCGATQQIADVLAEFFEESGGGKKANR